MEAIDAIKINFNQDQLFVLNLCLAFLMFGISLDMRVSDFVRVFKNPRIPLVGLFSEYILLPIIALVLILIFQPAPSIALGMILLSCCPGGTTSNYMVHLSKSNTALSVMLTSITTLGAIIVLPYAFSALSNLIPNISNFAGNISVEPSEMVGTLIKVLLVPITIGMFINANFPALTAKIQRPVKILSMIIFLGFVVVAVSKNLTEIKDNIHMVFLLVLLHNGLAFIAGYWFSKWRGLATRDARAISIETGIQNSGLGLVIVFNFFEDLGGMALIVAWWGIWHLITGFALATYWGNNAVEVEYDD